MTSPRCWAWIQVPALYPLQGTRPWRTVECEGVQGATPFGAHPRCTRRGARRGEGVRAMIRQAAFGTDCWNGYARIARSARLIMTGRQDLFDQSIQLRHSAA